MKTSSYVIATLLLVATTVNAQDANEATVPATKKKQTSKTEKVARKEKTSSKSQETNKDSSSPSKRDRKKQTAKDSAEQALGRKLNGVKIIEINKDGTELDFDEINTDRNLKVLFSSTKSEEKARKELKERLTKLFAEAKERKLDLDALQLAVEGEVFSKNVTRKKVVTRVIKTKSKGNTRIESLEKRLAKLEKHFKKLGSAKIIKRQFMFRDSPEDSDNDQNDEREFDVVEDIEVFEDEAHPGHWRHSKRRAMSLDKLMRKLGKTRPSRNDFSEVFELDLDQIEQLPEDIQQQIRKSLNFEYQSQGKNQVRPQGTRSIKKSGKQHLRVFKFESNRDDERESPSIEIEMDVDSEDFDNLPPEVQREIKKFKILKRTGKLENKNSVQQPKRGRSRKTKPASSRSKSQSMHVWRQLPKRGGPDSRSKKDTIEVIVESITGGEDHNSNDKRTCFGIIEVDGKRLEFHNLQQFDKVMKSLGLKGSMTVSPHFRNSNIEGKSKILIIERESEGQSKKKSD